ncbi:protein-export chaperone SecB [Dyadobacter chenhuakuii]|uniref:Protein-export chaperone SecB n=1 Tax=Dyadobacter chenhuakuii TaxID=2909339 RepID=A0A9X1QAZ7_9BACT|nr:protein-export chaperone SecB [Dyadobacter chenhuakuii]MCF2498405.1 protein-export chaperone SecB [Dyadobacter chenhuakuii]
MASFRIKKVFLVESTFKLDPSVNPGESVEFTLEVVMTNRQTVDETMIISVEVNVNGFGADRIDLLQMAVRMDGLFDLESDLPGPNEDYLANVNAPAIIYPFIREHIASITAKSGIEAILLPPFNFVEQYQKMQERIDAEGEK